MQDFNYYAQKKSFMLKSVLFKENEQREMFWNRIRIVRDLNTTDKMDHWFWHFVTRMFEDLGDN